MSAVTDSMNEINVNIVLVSVGYSSPISLFAGYTGTAEREGLVGL